MKPPREGFRSAFVIVAAIASGTTGLGPAIGYAIGFAVAMLLSYWSGLDTEARMREELLEIRSALEKAHKRQELAAAIIDRELEYLRLLHRSFPAGAEPTGPPS